MSFLKRFREANVRRCVKGFGHALEDWSGLEWGGALAGEAGELCNVLKKIRREEQGLAGSRVKGDHVEKIAEEIADVICYADLLAARYGIDLEEAIVKKFNFISQKLNYPETLR